MKIPTKEVCYLFFILNYSCSTMLSERSYLSEMNHEDGGFFTPNESFPVVGGDTGRWWRNDREIQRRTPASEAFYQEQMVENEISKERIRLENKLHDEDFKEYQLHLSYLPTDSEKIYYLKLPYRDARIEYLESKGVEFISSQNAKILDPFVSSQDNIEFSLGMTKADVFNRMGRPLDVEVSGNPIYENERWLYQIGIHKTYVYFESGRVDGWLNASN